MQKGWVLFGSWRVRSEAWNWFPTERASGTYAFLASQLRVGVSRQTSREETTLEIEQPTLIGLPTRAIAPAPQGQLGQGASYFDANGAQVASLFVKQAFVRFKNIGPTRNSLRIGRFEFADGMETLPTEPSLAYLKRERIGQRLIGSFGFTHVGRSFDGVQFTQSTTRRNLTALAVLPTRGVFDLNGMDTLADVRLAYLSATFPRPDSRGAADLRLFGAYYEDARGRAVKTDNRPVAARVADTLPVHLYTLGGHCARVFAVGKGKADALFWGAAQWGDWGALNHGAYAYAAEIGYQPPAGRMRPWLRAGYNFASGDGAAGNSQHGTFVPLLSTPRPYARFPFYTQSNLEDAFVQMILQPSSRLSLRTDLHGLRLADSHDLWYIGGGAYQNTSFGSSGRPSGGHNSLATVLDLSLDYRAGKNTSLTAYIAYAHGGDVLSSLYKSTVGAYGYLEMTQRF